MKIGRFLPTSFENEVKMVAMDLEAEIWRFIFENHVSRVSK